MVKVLDLAKWKWVCAMQYIMRMGKYKCPRNSWHPPMSPSGCARARAGAVAVIGRVLREQLNCRPRRIGSGGHRCRLRAFLFHFIWLLECVSLSIAGLWQQPRQTPRKHVKTVSIMCVLVLAVVVVVAADPALGIHLHAKRTANNVIYISS